MALSRRRLLQLAAVGGATIVTSGTLLAACGEEDSEVEASGAMAAAPQADSSPTDSSEESAAGNEAAGLPAEFVVANELEPSDLYPGFGSGYGGALVLRQIYQTLVEPRMTVDEQGGVTVEWVPFLAESIEQLSPTRWRFNLREGVTFHNGEEWNADAARFSFDALKDEENLALRNASDYLASITDFEVIDDMTIEVENAFPDTELPGYMLRIGFQAIPPKFVAENGFAALAENPIGTGPYRFESWTRGQEIRLTKFEDYWNEDGPNMPAVRYIVRAEATVRSQTIQAGEAHFAFNIGMEQAQTLDSYVIGAGFQSSGIRVNNTDPVTSDVRVRRALNHAIDREAIVESIFLGAAEPLSFFAFQPVDVEPYAYDPELATSLISEAGFEGAELEMVYGEGRIPEEDQLAEIYQASFEAIGLKIKLTKLEPRQYNELGGMPFDEQPPLYMETTSSGNFGEISGGLRDKYGCEGTGTYCDVELDEEFVELAGLSGDERVEALQSIAERLHEEAPRIWVAGVQQVHGLAEGVETDFPLNTYVLFDDIRFV